VGILIVFKIPVILKLCTSVEIIKSALILLMHDTNMKIHNLRYRGCKKVKKSLYVQALIVPRGCGAQISRQSSQDGGKISPTHQPPLPPGNIPVSHFC